MSVKYTYSIQNDFTNSQINPTRLTREIEGSSISGTLEYINTNSDVCDLYFESSLSGADESTLSGCITTHSGIFSEIVAGENIGSLKAVYMSGTGEVKLAKADTEDTASCIGLTPESASIGEGISVYYSGLIRGFSGLTPGAKYYLSQTNAGEITTQKPDDGIIVRVGIAMNSKELNIHILRLTLLEWKQSVRDISFAFGDVITKGTTWRSIRRFTFKGSDDLGIPTGCKSVAYMGVSGQTGSLQVYDTTNNNVIASINNITSTDPYDYEAPCYNIPTDKAIFEIRAQTDPPSANMYIDSFLLEFV